MLEKLYEAAGKSKTPHLLRKTEDMKYKYKVVKMKLTNLINLKAEWDWYGS